jgi:hypothetical protein
VLLPDGSAGSGLLTRESGTSQPVPYPTAVNLRLRAGIPTLLMTDDR